MRRFSIIILLFILIITGYGKGRETTKMNKENYTYIPTIKMLTKVTERNGVDLDSDLEPISEFSIINKNRNSEISSMMTDDLSLFNINIFNPDDEIMIKTLKEILELYNLPIEYLEKDIKRCYKDEDNFKRYYECFYVQYVPIEDDEDVILVEYRKLVDDTGENYMTKNIQLKD